MLLVLSLCGVDTGDIGNAASDRMAGAAEHRCRSWRVFGRDGAMVPNVLKAHQTSWLQIHIGRATKPVPDGLTQLVQPNAPDYLAVFYKPLIDLFFFTSTRAV